MDWKGVDESKVDNFFDRARQGLHCSLFCGGAKCKHESWEVCIKRKNADPAIEGLNSNWVGENVIASQRPSTSLFIKFPLIQQFKAANVNGVFNLQEKGEHASCGPDGVYPSTGYSYHGEQDLMRHGISYYEFPWPDMTAPDNDIVLRSVQVMDSHIRNKGRVLVHCHAGLGRTGLMIACYLLYSQRCSAMDAISLVRRSRPGAVQTSKQAQFVLDFEKHLKRLFLVFPIEITDNPVTLQNFMSRQRIFLHGEDAMPYRHIPQHIHAECCRIVALIHEQPRLAIAALEGLAPSAAPPASSLHAVRESMNGGTFDVNKIANVRLLSFLVLDWFRGLSEPALSAEAAGSFVAYIKETLTRDKKEHFGVVQKVLPRYVRHTIAMLLSFIDTVVGLGHLTEEHHHRGVQLVLDALILAHDPTQCRLSSVEQTHLQVFGYEWCKNVGTMFFDDTVAPPDARVVSTIAKASGLLSGSIRLPGSPVFSNGSSTGASVSVPPPGVIIGKGEAPEAVQTTTPTITPATTPTPTPGDEEQWK